MSLRLATRALLAALLLAPASGSAFEMIITVGSIPDDLREIDGQKTAGWEPLPLKRFAHLPHLTGSTIATLGADRLVVVDTDNDSVVVVDRDTLQPQKVIAVGRRPERLVVTPGGMVLVTNRGSRSVSLVDPNRGVELRSVSAGTEPLGLALDAKGETLSVTSSATGELLVFDAKALRLRFSVKVGAWPAAVAAHPSTRQVFVSHLYDPTVRVIDLDRQREVNRLTLPTSTTGLPGRLLGRGVQKRQSTLARALTVSPGGTRLFVAHTMVDTGMARSAAVVSTGYGAGAQAPIVATVSTFDLSTGKLIRPKVSFSHHDDKHFGRTSQADQQVQQLQQPVALAHDPRTSRLAVVGMGSDRVLSLSTRASDPITKPHSGHHVGHAPTGVAYSADGKSAFVLNSHDHSVQRIDLTVAMNSKARWQLPGTSAAVAFSKSPLPADALRGRRLFTFALNTKVGGANRFACASCHPDGRHDGMVWRIGAGPRKTPILADRLLGTGPFNWLGTEDKLVDNVSQTVRRLGGSGISPQDAADIATYMTRYMAGLDNPHRQPTPETLALVSEGRALFESAEVGCAGCHSGARQTDGALHDVGTTTQLEKDAWVAHLKRKASTQMSRAKTRRNPRPTILVDPPTEPPVSYNTPSLRHIWAAGPLMHDGSATDLVHLLTDANPGDRMGKTSHLKPKQIQALAAYMRTL